MYNYAHKASVLLSAQSTMTLQKMYNGSFASTLYIPLDAENSKLGIQPKPINFKDALELQSCSDASLGHILTFFITD